MLKLTGSGGMIWASRYGAGMEGTTMETTIPEAAIPAADDRMVIRIREALRDHVACNGRRVSL